jgi:hypothetical protein
VREYREAGIVVQLKRQLALNGYPINVIIRINERIDIMFSKIPKQDRKRFVIYSFIYLPIGLIVGFSIGTMLVKFIGFKITLGGFLFVFSFVTLAAILSAVNFYRKLTNNTSDRKT